MITFYKSPSEPSQRPWLVYVDGVMLRNKRGVGRRFKTKEAAHKAASA